MTATDATSLLVTICVAVCAVVLADRLRVLRIPLVIVEIAMGVLVGPSILGLVRITPLVDLVAEVGAVCLFFSIGFELSPARLRGRPLALGAAGWALSLTVGVVLSLGVSAMGVAVSPVAVGLALSPTALGVLLPVMRDAGIIESRLGTCCIAAGATAQVGTLTIAALLYGGDLATSALALIALPLIALLTVLVLRSAQAQRSGRIMVRTNRSTGQLPVRSAVLGVALLVGLGWWLGLNPLLTGLVAGLLTRAAVQDDTILSFRHQIDAIGFGLFIPAFFIVTGARFDLGALVASPLVPFLVVASLVAFFVVRGVTALLYTRLLDRIDRASFAFFISTHLPLVFIISGAAVRAGDMSSQTASILCCAAMTSVFVFPMLGLRSLRARETSQCPATLQDQVPQLSPLQAALAAEQVLPTTKEER